MLKRIAAASVIAILMGHTIPVSAQSETPGAPSATPAAPVDGTNERLRANPGAAPTNGEVRPETPSTDQPSPSTETQTEPSTTPSTEVQPSTTPTEIQPSTTPPTEVQPSTPSTEVQPSTPPSTEVQPSTPSTEVQPSTTPSTPTPPASPSAEVTPTQSTAKTVVLDEETITGIKEVSFPAASVKPAFLTLPLQVSVAKDASITSNTPITDKNASDLAAWSAAVRACAADRPTFVRKVGDQEVPFMINGAEGKVRLNANDKPVCGA